MKTAGIGAAGAMTTSALTPENCPAINDIEPMKITKVESVRFKKGGFMWVRIYTDNGLVGVGETYNGTNSEIGVLKDRAHYLIGKDPRNLEQIWKELYRQMAFQVTGGAEMRILSAINMAQWDLLGKSLGVPVYMLLGGKAQEKMRVYNTYTRGWTIDGMQMETDTEKITRTLLDKGIKGIKIVPYDGVARKNNGAYISPTDLDNCLDWVKRIRDTAGDEMEIAIECHSWWNLPCSLKIAKSLEPYNPMWLEDMMLPDNMQAYSVLARETSIPVANSERLATRYQFREMLEAKATDIVIYDLGWCGGITEAKKISDMADTYYIPTATHACLGPVQWNSVVHTATTLTNFWIMECSNYFYEDTFPHFVNNTPSPVNGFITAPDGPGLGVEFTNEPYTTGNATVELIAGG
jgi:galactonate dehydratase